MCTKPPKLFSKIQGPSEATHTPLVWATTRHCTIQEGKPWWPRATPELVHPAWPRYVFLDIYAVTPTTLTKPNMHFYLWYVQFVMSFSRCNPLSKKSRNIYILLPYNPKMSSKFAHLDIYANKLETYVQTDICTGMFTVTIFIIPPNWKQPRCLLWVELHPSKFICWTANFQ